MAPPVVPKVPHPTVTPVAPKPAVDCPPLFSISFDLNKAIPLYDPAAMVALVTWLLAHTQRILVIDGHADAQGSVYGNLGLSRWRAEEMAKRFVAADLPSARITRRAFGQYVPLVGTPGESSKNRRVDLSVTGTADCPVLEVP
jgi:outer membrane protein OmpA-like peptidoglycan-associated protein